MCPGAQGVLANTGAAESDLPSRMEPGRLRRMRLRYPKWAEHMAKNPPPGYDARREERFWRTMAWEVRFWLAFAALLSSLAIVGTLVLLVSRL
jgi:hypothetical protein